MLAVAIGTEKLSHKCMHQLILCVCVTPQHNKIKQNDTRNEIHVVLKNKKKWGKKTFPLWE